MIAPLRWLMLVPVPWVFILCYFLGVGFERFAPLKTGYSISENTSLVVGGIVFLVGAFIAGWGLFTFIRARTTTIPGKASSQLVTWGPYRFTRNPMYVGLTIAYVGDAILLHQLWPVLLLPLTLIYLNWVVIPVEQGKLTEVFGEEYVRYTTRVRRWV